MDDSGMARTGLAMGTTFRLFALVALLSGCGSGSSETEKACTPGVSSACTCTTGSQGAQTCLADGVGYGVCTCTSGAGGAPQGTGGAAGGTAPMASGGTMGTGGTSPSTGGAPSGSPGTTGGSNGTGGTVAGTGGRVGTGGIIGDGGTPGSASLPNPPVAPTVVSTSNVAAYLCESVTWTYCSRSTWCATAPYNTDDLAHYNSCVAVWRAQLMCAYATSYAIVDGKATALTCQEDISAQPYCSTNVPASCTGIIFF